MIEVLIYDQSASTDTLKDMQSIKILQDSQHVVGIVDSLCIPQAEL